MASAAAAKAHRARLWTKMIAGGAAMCIGGPALVIWVTPTEEELINKYNPDLKRRALENREQRKQDFDDFVNNLKKHSKSDKPIWISQAEADEKTRAMALRAQRAEELQAQKRREEIRQQALNGN